MRKTPTKAVAVAGFALLVTIGATGQASAISSGQCVEGGGLWSTRWTALEPVSAGSTRAWKSSSGGRSS